MNPLTFYLPTPFLFFLDLVPASFCTLCGIGAMLFSSYSGWVETQVESKPSRQNTGEQNMALLTGLMCNKRNGCTLKRSVVCRHYIPVQIFGYGFGTIMRGIKIDRNEPLTYSQIHWTQTRCFSEINHVQTAGGAITASGDGTTLLELRSLTLGVA